MSRSARLSRSRWLSVLLASGLASVGAVAIGAVGTNVTAWAASTDVLSSNQSNAGPYQDSFNPYLSTSAASTAGLQSMIYEPLLQYDGAKPSNVYPWLATSYKSLNHNRTFIFYLRHNVQWSDGKPFTANDVVFTFDALKRNPAINTNGIQFTSVTAVNKYEVKFQLASPNASELYYIATTYIVPEHIWQSVNPSTYADSNPVGTGPYVLKSFATTDIQLTANPHYWGGSPHVATLNFPMSDSDQSADTMMAAGGAQWGGHNFGDVAKLYINGDPKYRHYWYIPTTSIQLLPNLTQYPFNNVDFRKALSESINRLAIQNEAEHGYEYAIKTPTGLLLPNFSNELAPQFKNLHYIQNVAAARALLAKAGFTRKGSGPLIGKDGKAITLNIVLPSPYFDWFTVADILSSQWKALGIKLNVQGVSLGTWQSDEALGNFGLTLNVGNSGPSQYYIYNGLLNNRLTAPIGQTATGDLERWSSPATQRLLSTYESGTPAQQAAALDGLESVVVNDLPYIPLIYQSGWFQYSNKDFVGWPTSQNPYAIGAPNGLNAELVVLHLRPRS